MGCMPGRRHWHHYTPITPGEESPLCWVGQGDKNLSIHPALGRGCPWSLSPDHQDGDGRSSPCVPLPPPDNIKGFKKRSESVQVSASHTGQGALGDGNLEVQRDGPGCICWVVAREWVHGEGSELSFWGQRSGTAVQQSSAGIAEPCQCSVPVPELVSVLDCHCRSPSLGGSYQEARVQVCFRAWAPAV